MTKPVIKKREPKEKPKDVKIIQFSMMAVPSQSPALSGQQVMSLMTHGLGSDSLLYQFDQAEQKWYEI